jgi:hypothetical protein
MERSIVGGGGFFFDFFPLLVFVPAMMTGLSPGAVISAALCMVTKLDQMERPVPRNKVGGESAELMIQYDLLVLYDGCDKVIVTTTS